MSATAQEKLAGEKLPARNAGPGAEPVPWAALAALVVLATVLRVIGLNRQLWLDEYYFVMDVVRRPLAEIVTLFAGDIQHMFYSVLTKISVLALGEHPWTLRLPAMLFGVGGVPALYFLGREVTTRRESLLAATLLTVSYHHVWFSQNARGYTGMLFFAMVSSIFLLRGLRNAKWSNWMWYGVTAALGVYTHLTMVFVVVSHAVICTWLLLRPASRGDFQVRDWKRPAAGIALSAFLTLVLYAPVLMQMQQFFNKPSRLQNVSTPAWAFWETLRGLSIGFGTLAGVAVAGTLFLAGLWSYWRQAGVVAAVFIVPGLATASGAVIARGTMYPRFYFYLLGFGVLILVRGAMWLTSDAWKEKPASASEAQGRQLAGTLVVTLMIIGSAAMLSRNYMLPKQDFIGAMQFAETRLGMGEQVVTVGEMGYVYRAYYGRPWPQVENEAQLRMLRNEGRPVWVLYVFPRYIAPSLMDAIRANCSDRQVFPGTVGDGEITACRVERAGPKSKD